jgi:hypothetical protein
MKILPPDSISSELLNLIHAANEYLVLVSPYVRIGQWARLSAALTSAQRRGVKIKAFVRYDPDNASSWEELEALGIRPRLVANLHAKFYFNETGGLISSLNLLSSSNASALEIGCKLETDGELQELKNFVKRYIVPLEQTERPSEDDLYLSKEKFTILLENGLHRATNSRSRVLYRNNQLEIQAAGNTFYLEIDRGANRVEAVAIFSGDEADAYEQQRLPFTACPQLKYTLSRGQKGHYTTLHAVYERRLSTTYLDQLRLPEKMPLLEALVEFVVGVREFKNAVYTQQRARLI